MTLEELEKARAESLSEVATVEKKPKFEGRGIAMFLVPKTDK